MKIYNSLTIREQADSKPILGTRFAGPLSNALSDMSDPAAVYMPKDLKQNAHEMEVIRQDILAKVRANAAYVPTDAEIEAFFGKFFIDVTRRAAQTGDLTSVIANETVNFNFPGIINLSDVLPFRGKMGTISGQNDAVPLIEQHTGNTDTITLAIKAVGWKDSLKNLLFNKFFTMDKVVQAAVDAYTDERNQAVVGPIIGATYVASQQQAAVNTAGLTLDEKTYETLLAAWKKLKGLLDPKTGRPINASQVYLLGNSANTWQIENVIRGQLNGNGSSARTTNRPGLPINAIVEYDQGINNGFVIGKETVSVPGVAPGKCYLFVPGVLQVATKRPLTMETGRGSVLELSTEERSWYTVFGVSSKDFLGSSYPGTSLGAQHGFVVEVTLPS